MLLPKGIRTSGAYVLYKGFFVFQFGPTREGNKLGVVRLGGHREDEETALETAIREVYEEAKVAVALHNPPATFLLSHWNEKPIEVEMNEPIAPILMKGDDESSYTAMYLMHTSTCPIPSSESKGLLLLPPEKIQLICKSEMAFSNFQEMGGVSIIQSEIDSELILQPFPQLSFLSRLLSEENEMIRDFINTSLSH